MRSRGAFRGQAQRSKEAMKSLEVRLRAIAEREASIRVDAYEMLEIVTNVIGDLEDAGDNLVSEFEAYENGKKTYQGGSFIGRLIKAVIKFINSWRSSKNKLEQILEKQDSIKKQLELKDGSNS